MDDTKYNKSTEKYRYSGKKRRKYNFSEPEEEVKVEEKKDTIVKEKPVTKKKVILEKEYTIGKRYVVKTSNVTVMSEPSSKETNIVCKLLEGEQVVCRQVKKNSEGIWINNGSGWLQASTSNGKVYIG